MMEPFPFDIVWGFKIPTFVKFCIWSLVGHRVLTVDKLVARGFVVPNLCSVSEYGRGCATSLSILSHHSADREKSYWTSDKVQ
ncbi:hypothetical protein AQUCO_02100114v1 [Aquilegia coerulea]|uniref:Reverse transcriptase zinc-binding domain-containing protein n=1 Tax=Aquilegia coerulea TaxID=218851 RepID=A0A2G5DEX8_AQUCA|nr:hypothetical protein AQUCO_02100114v1 [Aquilegia coerulea]